MRNATVESRCWRGSVASFYDPSGVEAYVASIPVVVLRPTTG